MLIQLSLYITLLFERQKLVDRPLIRDNAAALLDLADIRSPVILRNISFYKIIHTLLLFG